MESTASSVAQTIPANEIPEGEGVAEDELPTQVRSAPPPPLARIPSISPAAHNRPYGRGQNGVSTIPPARDPLAFSPPRPFPLDPYYRLEPPRRFSGGPGIQNHPTLPAQRVRVPQMAGVSKDRWYTSPIVWGGMVLAAGIFVGLAMRSPDSNTQESSATKTAFQSQLREIDVDEVARLPEEEPRRFLASSSNSNGPAGKALSAPGTATVHLDPVALPSEGAGRESRAPGSASSSLPTGGSLASSNAAGDSAPRVAANPGDAVLSSPAAPAGPPVSTTTAVSSSTTPVSSTAAVASAMISAPAVSSLLTAQDVSEDRQLIEQAVEGEDVALLQLELKTSRDRTFEDVVALAEGREVLARKEANELARKFVQMDPDHPDEALIADMLKWAADPYAYREAQLGLARHKSYLGPSLLFDVARQNRHNPTIAEFAQMLLANKSVYGRATAALQVAIDGWTVQDCQQARKLLHRAERVADSRAVFSLAKFAQRRGCGPDQSEDCYPCLRDDALLVDSLKAARGRAPKH